MPWTGSGAFTRLYNWVQDALNGIDIEATRMDNEDDNFRAGIEECLTKDGQNAPTQNLGMAGNRHTGVGNAVNRDEYLVVGQYQDGWGIFAGDSAGVAPTWTAVLNPVITAYVEGMRLWFVAHEDCEDDNTMNVNTIGDVFLQIAGENVKAGDIKAGDVVAIIYSGGFFSVFLSRLYKPEALTTIGCSIFAETPVDDQLFPAGGANTAVLITGELFDSNDYHDPVTNRSRITIPTDGEGVYQYEGQVVISAPGVVSTDTDEFNLHVALNGALASVKDIATVVQITGADIPSGIPFSMKVSGYLVLADDDFVELVVTNDNGTEIYELDFTVGGKAASFSLVRVGSIPV